MTCTKIDLGNGAVAIVCSRGRKPGPPCRTCGSDSPYLCDFPLKGRAAGRTCSAPMCEKHRHSLGPNVDYCPTHARMHAEQGKLDV